MAQSKASSKKGAKTRAGGSSAGAKPSNRKSAKRGAKASRDESQLTLDLNRVIGSPAKRLFLDVLTRDIPRARAILDLIDNSVDGAIRMRGAPQPSLKLTEEERDRYRGLFVKVRCLASEFSIDDNCGGIPLNVARFYAFRFGHDHSNQERDNAPSGSRIGLFGIGMKRALFKLGRDFSVESVTPASRFVIDLNSQDWLKKDSWDLEFSSFDQDYRRPDAPEIGTRIKVRNLYSTVSADFARPEYGSELLEEIELAFQQFIQRGLSISVQAGTVENVEISAKEIAGRLKVGGGIKPFVTTYEIPDTRENPDVLSPVAVRMYVGVGKASLAYAGWYVFCNGRLVEGPGQDSSTGWGVREPAKIPKYHNQFDRFYGYVFLDCDDPARLPWNSTKTGLEEDSPLYRSVRQQMIIAMRPVIDMLNQRRKQEGLPESGRVIDAALIAASEQHLSEIPESATFEYPTEVPIENEVVSIKLSLHRDDVLFAQGYFKVTSEKQAIDRVVRDWLSLRRP